MLKDLGIHEELANNLFIDLELNKLELERLIKNNIDEEYLNLNYYLVLMNLKKKQR